MFHGYWPNYWNLSVLKVHPFRPSDPFLYIFQVAVVGFVSGDKLDAFNAAGDSFDDVPFGVLDADAAAALEVAEGQVALLKQVSIT